MFAVEGFINATILLILLAVVSQAILWVARLFPPEDQDLDAYRNVVLQGPGQAMSITFTLIVWSIIAGITAIFFSVDFVSLIVTTIVASFAMFTVGKLAYTEIFLNVNFHQATVQYHSDYALLYAAITTILASIIVAYPLALCFGWVYWVAAVAIGSLMIWLKFQIDNY